MIIKTELKDVKKSQEFETIQYGVSTENLPLLFQMLRTNLYSDIHGSIIREVVSNVVDSHTEAGKKDEVGEVEWIDENRLLGVDSQLIIRDRGVGLSPERMKNIYGNYLSSTKRGDNESIGGFGLGSKVPFAYTDSFFIKTVFDGTEYKYLCYIDETQLGAISTLETKPTTAENGTEIIIPVKNRWDKEKFQDAIERQLSYFKNIKYIGLKGPSDEVLFEDDTCIIKKDPPFTDVHIVLGQVAYPLDFNALGINKWHDNITNSGIGLKFKIGEIQPTLSRESLFWSESVKKKVHSKIAQARQSIRKEIEKDLATEKNYCTWYVNVQLQKTKKFPSQWTFSNVKTNAEYSPQDGSPALKSLNQTSRWFAGLNMKTVNKWQGYTSRRSKVISKTPEYTTSTTTVHHLHELPVYRFSGTLSARKTLFLFKTYPDGFIAVNDYGVDQFDDNDKKLYEPYYNQASKWAQALPDYDAIEVPEDQFTTTSDEDYKDAYRKILAQRKLEGKFTAKKLVRIESYSRDLSDAFSFKKYEGKFEEHKTGIVIYGTQDSDDLLIKAGAILTYIKRFTDIRDQLINVTILKVSQQNLKQFKLMNNAYEVTEVFKMKTALNVELGNIATAHMFEEKIHVFKVLKNFQNINSKMKENFDTVYNFISSNLKTKRWHRQDLMDEVVKLCKESDSLNTEIMEKVLEMEEYFNGAELLEYVEFSPNSEEFIKDFLVSKGKAVDFPVGLPETVKFEVKIDEPNLVESL